MFAASRLLAIGAIILAFPPIFTSFGKNEGLKLSLALFLYYLIQGLLCLLAMSKGGSRLKNLMNHSRLFHFSEIPMLLSSIWIGLKWIPVNVLRPYEYTLIWCCPVAILLEALAAMIIILDFGETWTESLSHSSIAFQLFIALLCISAYAVGAYTVRDMYISNMINNVTSASLVAVILTLIVVLTIATILVDHGTITDSSLLFLYITYNLWTMTRKSSFIPRSFLSKAPLSIMNSVSSLLWNFFSENSIYSMIQTAINMFSVEVMAMMLIQMAFFLMATKLIAKSREQNNNYTEFVFEVFWPCFGKCLLVLVYTYAWLIYGQHYMIPIPWWIDPVFWRWINIFACILIYTWHLIVPPSHDYELKYE